MAEYRLPPAAERDLESIWVYTVRQWGVEHANRYINFLTAAFAELMESPKQPHAVGGNNPDSALRRLQTTA